MVAVAKVCRMKFNAKLEMLLAHRGVRQIDLATVIGRAQSRISKWVHGTGSPTPADLWRLSQALGVSLRYFCDDAIEDVSMATLTEQPGETVSYSTDEAIVIALMRKKGPRWALDRLLAAEHEPDVVPEPETESPQYRQPLRPGVTFPVAESPPADPPKKPAAPLKKSGSSPKSRK